MQPRLPTPGSDAEHWGDILNDFLRVVHNENGQLKSNVVPAVQLGAGSVTAPSIQDSTISESKLAQPVKDKLNALASVTGGREVELQANSTHIQWRYVGDSTWTNLVVLDDLRGIQGVQGPQGQKGDKGDKGDNGTPGTTDYNALTNKPDLDARDTVNRARISHTGTQSIATIDGLQGVLDGKENTLAKGSLVAGTNVTLSGTTTGRLVGGGDVIINATSGGGGSTAPNFFPQTPPNRWLGPYFSGYVTNQPPVAGGSYIPIRVFRRQTWDALGIFINTAAAGTIGLALYGDEGGYPGSRIVDAGIVDSSTTGQKALTITPIVLGPGLYWGWVGISNNAVRVPVTSHTGAGEPSTLWHTGVMGNNTTIYHGGYNGVSATPPAVAPAGLAVDRYISLVSLRASTGVV